VGTRNLAYAAENRQWDFAPDRFWSREHRPQGPTSKDRRLDSASLRSERTGLGGPCLRATIFADTRETAISAREFVLVSHWHLDAPIRRVWDALHEPTDWPRWWPFVAAVEKLQGGDTDGVGARYRFHWTSRLPYSIRLVTQVLEVTKPRAIRASAAGDLEGEGTWRLAERDGGTDVEYTWRVNLDRAWMRLFAPLMRPVFTWNHNAVMTAGESGLRRYLRAQG